MNNATNVTAGALAVSLAATGYHLWQWWKTPGHRPRDLADFGGSYILGGLSTVCAGLLGVLAGWTVLLGNGLGKHAVSGTAGGSADRMNHGTAGELTPGGRIVVFLLAVAFVVAWKAASKAVKKKLFWGWFSGATMTFTVGVASLFVYVVNAANGIGDSGYNWFNTGGGL